MSISLLVPSLDTARQTALSATGSTGWRGCELAGRYLYLAMSFQWFRMWTDAIDDEKLKLLAFEDRWHFVALLCLKRTGLLDEPPSDLKIQKICVKMGLDRLELETAMKRLVTVGLINEAFQPLKWKKRQFESDSSTSRVRAFRKRQSNKPETFQKRPQTTDSDTDTESEKNKTPPAIAGSPARASRSARATRLPEDFVLTPQRRAIAEAEKADPDREFQNFTDHWKAAAGSKARKNDWDATWRIWCRRAPEFQRKGVTKDEEPRLTWRPPDNDGNPDHARRR